MTAKCLVFSHYDLLGVSQTASLDEILDAENALRRVYEARARRAGGDATAFDVLRRLDDAHSVLFDARQRAAYDRDPTVLSRSYVDVAYPLPIGRYAKLEQLKLWLDEELTASRARDKLDDWARPDPLLDQDGVG
jgi:curved DNA-binding protein CbpA